MPYRLGNLINSLVGKKIKNALKLPSPSGLFASISPFVSSTKLFSYSKFEKGVDS